VPATEPWRCGGVTEETHSYIDGTLVLGLISMPTKGLFWRAWARCTVEDQTQGHRKIDRTLDAMFARVPPSTARDASGGP
jgi:hypothetical protein